MQKENRFFDDLSKMLNGLAGSVAGAGREAQTQMRERAQEFMGGLDFVSREEFDAVKIMAATARAEVDVLKARLDALEGKGAKAPAAPMSTATTAAPKPAAPRKAAATRAAPKPQAKAP